MTHNQMWVKVNALCDEGIEPLVSALNELYGVITLDSCQEGAWGAYVFFTYGSDWKQLACLLQEMSSCLSNLRLPCGYRFLMEWFGSNDKPRAELQMEPEHVVYVADGVQRIAASLNARMTELAGGR